MTVMIRWAGRCLGWVRAHAGLVALLAIIVIVPLAIAYRGAELRDDRRKANAAAVRANDERIDRLALEARINRQVALIACQVENENARALNRLINYFELVNKATMPGPITNAFWDSVPRPAIRRCAPGNQPVPGARGP